MTVLIILLSLLAMTAAFIYAEQLYYYLKYRLEGESYKEFCERYYKD